jgi:hypothetical protein
MSDVNIQTFSGKVNVTDNFKVGTSHFFVDTQDNKVGLNTATPNSSLHVNGNAYVATDISFGGILSGNGSGLTSVNSDSGLWAGAGTGNVYLSTSTDNVGIGTSSPGAKLDVNGSILLPNSNFIATSLTDVFTYDGDSMPHYGLTWRSHTQHTGAKLFQLSGYNGVKFFTQGTERFFIDVSGNVGIGTDAPTEKLDVYGTGMRIHDPAASPKIDLLRGGSSRDPNTDTFGASDYVDWRITSGPQLKFQQQYTGANSGQLLDVMTLEHSTGNVGIGTTSPGAKLHVDGGELRVTNADTATAEISVHGSSQGTGRLYVGQSTTYGGGIEYNGDNNPVTSGSGSDYIALYRRNNGTNYWTARNFYNNNDWEFLGSVKTPLLNVNGTTMSKAPRVINIDDNRSGCPPAQAANTPIMQYSLTLSRTAYVYVSVTTILIHTSRADCHIYFGNTLQQAHLTATDNTSWNPVNITAGGTLGAGTHSIVFRCSTANVVGCQKDWGGMQILVFET